MKTRFFMNVMVVLVLVVWGMGFVSPVQAVTVTTTVDENDGCGTGDCSLREAVAAGGNIDFSLPGSPPWIITLSSEIQITQDVTITGPTTGALAISGGSTTRVFYVPPAASNVNFNISGVTIKNGSNTNGAGIYNFGKLTVTNCTFTGNVATYGGGIYSKAGATLTVSNCTFKGNAPQGIFNSGNLNIKNTILEDGYRHLGGSVNTLGYNILDGSVDGGGTHFTHTEDQTNTTGLNLGSFENVTQTFPLQTSSTAALDSIPHTTNECGTTLIIDQRGAGRPFPASGACDIGAYESQPDINVKEGSTGVANGSSYDFGNVELGASSAEKTFTIENLGSPTLTFASGVAISGTHPSYFTLTDSTTSPVTGGSSTTFKIKFNPPAPPGGSAGAKSAKISIADNNDPDENPYEFTVEGNAEANPKINVKNPSGVTITNSGSYDFPLSTKVGNSSSAMVFTIESTGTGSLDLSGGITSNNTEFVVGGPAATSVVPGASTTFTITFQPSATDGAKAGTISIANNSTVNPYTFTVNGTATLTAPEINVRQGVTNISTGSSYSFMDTKAGKSSSAIEFEIENTGDAGTGLTLSGSPKIAMSGDTSDFTVVQTSVASPVSDGDSTSFTVAFNPVTAGAKTAAVSIANNDSDETPYTFTVAGTGTATAPEINVRQGATNISTGGSYSFMDTKAGESSSAIEFEIENTGDAGTGLTLSGSPKIAMSGDTSDFTVVQTSVTSPVGDGSSTSFTVAFNPGSAGTKTATVSFANNDSDETPYTFDVTGEGTLTAPEIEVLQGSDNIETDLSNLYGFLPTMKDADSSVIEFTIKNTGDVPLNLEASKVEVSGSNPGDFIINDSSTNSSVGASGGTTKFYITFHPADTGTREGTVTIATNDSDENPYTFTVRGEGVDAAPEIKVTDPGGEITSGGTPYDFYDFGEAGLGVTTSPVAFTIKNEGNAPLSLSGTPIVEEWTGDASDFILSHGSTSSSVSASASTFFTIAFNPQTAGDKIMGIRIVNNDSDENPYTFEVKGFGKTAPEINLRQSSTNIASGGSYSFGNRNVGSSSGAVGFTIENVGNQDLYLTGDPRVTLSGSSDFSLNNTTSSPISGGSSTSFTINFTPSSVGNKTATVTIPNNDSNEGTYRFTVAGTGKTSQTITFNSLSNKTYGDSSFTISASATSGLGVTFTSLTPSVATVSGNRVTIVAAGTATIRASQEGNAYYHAAPNVDRSFNVSKADQTIIFGALPVRTYGELPFTLSATTSSGLPVTFTSLNPSVATVIGNSVSIAGAGTAAIRASQAGDANYNAAPNVEQPLVISGLSQEITTFTFDPPLSTVLNIGDSFTISATTSSGLPVVFTVQDTSVARVSGNTLAIIGHGSTALCATQPGNSNYSPADDICRTLGSNAPPFITEGSSITVKMDEDGSPTAFSLTLNATDAENHSISWSVSSQASYGKATATGTGTSKRITYRPDSDWNGSDLFEVKVSDGKGGTDAIMVNVKVAAINDAPILDANQSPALTDIQEDNTTNNGNTVAEIVVDGSVTDPDGTATEAIAVTSVDNTNGLWQYSTNNGASWNDFTSETGEAFEFGNEARLLTSTHRIRFVPNLDYNGGSTFTFRAWDRSDGSAGSIADSDDNGGITAFSPAEDTAIITVAAVDDPPKVVNPILDRTVHEDAYPEYIDLADVFMDTDSDNTSIVKTVQSNTGESLVRAVIEGDNLSLEYQPNQFGTAIITILGASDQNSVTDVFTVTIIPENDAPDNPVVNPDQFPTLTPIYEDDFYNNGNTIAEIFLEGFINDVDGDPVDAIAVTSVNNIMGKWQYSLSDGPTWHDFTSETGSVVGMEKEARLLASYHRIRFVPLMNYYGKSRFTFRAWDKTDGSIPGGTADASDKGGSGAFSLVANDASIQVMPVDDPPRVAYPIGQIVADKDEQKETVNLTNVFTDPDSDPAMITKAVESNTNTFLVTASVQDNTLTLDYSGLLGEAIITLRADSNGKEARDVFVVKVTEEPHEWQGPDPVPPGLTPINEDSFSNNGNTVDEIFGENFLSDVDFFEDAEGKPIEAIAVTGLSNRIGKWQYSTDYGMTWDDFSPGEGFVYMEADARLLDSSGRIRFVPKEDYYGKAEFTFRAWDMSIGEPGWTMDTTTEGRNETAFSSAYDEVSVRVNPVDDPPIVENPLKDIILPDEDPSDRMISLYGVFTDIDNDPGLVAEALKSNTNPSLVIATVKGNILTLDFQEGRRGQAEITILAASNGLTVTDTFIVKVGVPNNPPEMATDETSSLTTITKVDSDSAGNTVGEIVPDGSIADADGAVEAIAVTVVDNTNGVWQYSLDDGESWDDFSTADGVDIIENEAVLLDPESRIRFVPDPGFVGDAFFTYRAYDMSIGNPGDTADAGISGPETAFSSNENEAWIRVTACVPGYTIPGDTDANEIIDLGDAILALKILADIDTEEDVCIYADVDDDGKIGMAEIVHVLGELTE